MQRRGSDRPGESKTRAAGPGKPLTRAAGRRRAGRVPPGTASKFVGAEHPRGYDIYNMERIRMDRKFSVEKDASYDNDGQPVNKKACIDSADSGGQPVRADEPPLGSRRGKLARRLSGERQMSEAMIVSAFLAFSGGFQDAYTYIVRDHVFANAQTGNIVLMSTHFLAREWGAGIRYLFPVLSFAAGVLCAEQLESHQKNAFRVHWRQAIVLLEILILACVSFIPQQYNTLANMMVSFSCAMQVQAFRKVAGNPYASTMCIGNLQKGTAALSAFLRTKQNAALRRSLYYFGVILIFAIGAGVGGNLSALFGGRIILVSAAVLGAAYLLMELEKYK